MLQSNISSLQSEQSETGHSKSLQVTSRFKKHQIGQPGTVEISSESEEFKTVIGCPILCIFDRDNTAQIFSVPFLIAQTVHIN